MQSGSNNPYLKKSKNPKRLHYSNISSNRHSLDLTSTSASQLSDSLAYIRNLTSEKTQISQVSNPIENSSHHGVLKEDITNKQSSFPSSEKEIFEEQRLIAELADCFARTISSNFDKENCIKWMLSYEKFLKFINNLKELYADAGLLQKIRRIIGFELALKNENQEEVKQSAVGHSVKASTDKALVENTIIQEFARNLGNYLFPQDKYEANSLAIKITDAEEILNVIKRLRHLYSGEFFFSRMKSPLDLSLGTLKTVNTEITESIQEKIRLISNSTDFKYDIFSSALLELENSKLKFICDLKHQIDSSDTIQRRYEQDSKAEINNLKQENQELQKTINRLQQEINYNEQQKNIEISKRQDELAATRQEIENFKYQSQGLENLGNSSYLNSVVQVLTNIQEFKDIGGFRNQINISLLNLIETLRS